MPANEAMPTQGSPVSDKYPHISMYPAQAMESGQGPTVTGSSLFPTASGGLRNVDGSSPGSLAQPTLAHGDSGGSYFVDREGTASDCDRGVDRDGVNAETWVVGHLAEHTWGVRRAHPTALSHQYRYHPCVGFSSTEAARTWIERRWLSGSVSYPLTPLTSPRLRDERREQRVHVQRVAARRIRLAAVGVEHDAVADARDHIPVRDGDLGVGRGAAAGAREARRGCR